MDFPVLALIYAAFQVLGVVSSINAVMGVRTPQGAIAWSVALICLPVLSVPFYWIFGRSKFRGYQVLRGLADRRVFAAREEARREVSRYFVDNPESHGLETEARLAGMPPLTGNSAELLIDGEATFDSIFTGIDQAKRYVLVQFYIVRDDGLGRKLKEKLIGAASRGVRVWFLYDEIGSPRLDGYRRELEEAGVTIRPFHSSRGRGNRFQLNFRNHRKIVVVDGSIGWVGGHNVGDEYVGLSPKFPNWRDTHVKLVGPSVLQLQLAFLEDWHWAAGEILDIPWKTIDRGTGDAIVLVVPTGPADVLETCSLMFQHQIHSARQRFWVASPYFVPDLPTLSALLLASLRGVDVRILIPEKPDNPLVYYSAYAFLGGLLDQGIAVYRYQPGFLHEKAFLVDDRVCGIGTANLDNRSFRLNFEVTAIIESPALVGECTRMFESDFARSRKMTPEEVGAKPLWFRVAARVAYLSAPIQ